MEPYIYAEGLTEEQLQTALKEAGVSWEKHDVPDFEVTDDGRLKLTICTSFSWDAGYSSYDVGYGSNLKECIADLHDPED